MSHTTLVRKPASNETRKPIRIGLVPVMYTRTHSRTHARTHTRTHTHTHTHTHTLYTTYNTWAIYTRKAGTHMQTGHYLLSLLHSCMYNNAPKYTFGSISLSPSTIIANESAANRSTFVLQINGLFSKRLQQHRTSDESLNQQAATANFIGSAAR